MCMARNSLAYVNARRINFSFFFFLTKQISFQQNKPTTPVTKQEKKTKQQEPNTRQQEQSKTTRKNLTYAHIFISHPKIPSQDSNKRRWGEITQPQGHISITPFLASQSAAKLTFLLTKLTETSSKKFSSTRTSSKIAEQFQWTLELLLLMACTRVWQSARQINLNLLYEHLEWRSLLNNRKTCIQFRNQKLKKLSSDPVCSLKSKGIK